MDVVIVCLGCGAVYYTHKRRDMRLAVEHDDTDACGKRGDYEADGWRLESR